MAQPLKTLGVIVIRVLGAGAAFVLNVAIARLLPTDQAGLVFLALGIVSVLSSIGIIGMNTTVLRFVSPPAAQKDWAQVNAIVLRAVAIAGCSLLCLTTLLWVFSGEIATNLFNKPDLEAVLARIAPAILFVGLTIVASHCLAARTEASRSIFVLSVGIPSAAAGLLALLRPQSAADVATSYVGASLVTLIIGAAWWLRGLPHLKAGSFDITQIIQSGMSLWVVTLMGQVVQWSAQFVAGYWMPAEELAKFAAAQRTAMLISFVLIAINMIVAPKFSSLYSEARMEELGQLARRILYLTAGLSLPALLILCIFPRQILYVFGSQFAEASDSLLIMAVGQVINLVFGSMGYLLTVTGHENSLRNAVLVSGPFAVLLSLALIPTFGSLGAASASAISVAAQSLIVAWLVRKRIGINVLTASRSREKGSRPDREEP